MKKLRFVMILLASFLIVAGIAGFAYLIHINGAGQGPSWGLGMGPLLVGLFLLMATTLRKERRNANTLP